MRPLDLPEDPAAWETSRLEGAPLPTWRLVRPGIALDVRQTPGGLCLTLRWEAPAISAHGPLALLPHEGRLADATPRQDPRDGDGPPLFAALRLASEAGGARAALLQTALSAAADAWTLVAGQATVLEIAPDGAWTVLPTGGRAALADGQSPPPLLAILRAWAGPMRRRPPHKPQLLACLLGHPPANAHRRLARRSEAEDAFAALGVAPPEGFLPSP